VAARADITLNAGAGLSPAGLRALADEACRQGKEAGLDAVGIAPADVFGETRSTLERRREEGLAAGMQFTYRNPARATDPARVVPGAAALVVGARRYVRRPPPAGGERPTPAGPAGRVARYSWTDAYDPLRAALGVVADRLSAAGWRARVLADDNGLVDREAAYRAGLGWYGKNTNLLLGDQGSWFVLGSVVTDAPLPATRPAAERPADAAAHGCGSCTRCLSACPTGALVAPGVLDARRCLAWLVQAAGTFPSEYREALGDRLYGCDDCQEVCPINRRALRADPAPPAEAGSEPAVDVLELLAASDEELLARWGRWYIAERDPAHLRRNALLVLGNVGSGDDPRVVDALRAALVDPRPVVRAHAVWAAARVDRRELLDVVVGDPDPAVRAEVAHAPAPRSDSASGGERTGH
jgi:epoxyqueuosine reductase